jgi:capsular polysaccharide biosynthesis protein
MQVNDVPPTQKKSYKKIYILMLILFLLAMPIGLVLAGVVTYLMPKKFESVAVLQVKPHILYMESGFVNDSHAMQSSNLIANELVQIQSYHNLKKATKMLKLEIHWALSEDVCVEILRGIVSAQSIRGTDLIEVKVLHTSPDECKDIAQAFSDAYRENRKEMYIEKTKNYLIKLEEEVRKQYELVQQNDDPLERDVLEKMKEKLSTTRIDVSPSHGDTFDHQAAELPMNPVSPNVTLNLICGAVGLPLLVLLFCLPISCSLLMKSRK